jgi:hypothetical protein
MEPQIPTLNVNMDLLVYIASLVLTLAFSYFPKLNTWYAVKSTDFKKLFMAGLLFVTLVVLVALNCFNLIAAPGLVCTRIGIIDTLIVYLVAIAINQGVFNISPVAKAVREIKDRLELAKLVALSGSNKTMG